MSLRLVTGLAPRLSDYARVPSVFEVKDRLEICSLAHGSCELDRLIHRVNPSYTKDYDRIPGNSPVDWAARWDVSKWWFASMFDDAHRIGGAAVIMEPQAVDPAASDPTIAILRDIRVHPDFRRRGFGRRLLKFAEGEAQSLGKIGMKAETQNINVPACKLYASAGYKLVAVNARAYPDLPDEVQLVWEKKLW